MRKAAFQKVTFSGCRPIWIRSGKLLKRDEIWFMENHEDSAWVFAMPFRNYTFHVIARCTNWISHQLATHGKSLKSLFSNLVAFVMVSTGRQQTFASTVARCTNWKIWFPRSDACHDFIIQLHFTSPFCITYHFIHLYDILEFLWENAWIPNDFACFSKTAHF